MGRQRTTSSFGKSRECVVIITTVRRCDGRSISRDWSQESSFVLREAICLMVLTSHCQTLRVRSDFTSVSLIRFYIRKAKNSNGDIVRAGFSDIRKAE